MGGSEVPAELRLADLENSLAQVNLDPTENIPLLAPLLDITLPHRPLTLTAEELRFRARLTARPYPASCTDPHSTAAMQQRARKR